MNFKKRRPHKTVNKNEAKVRRLQATLNRPAMSALYGDVQSLSVQLDFYSQEGHLLLQQTREFEPSDTVDFTTACPGRCGNGTMDLEGKLKSMIQQRETVSQSRAKCAEILYTGAEDVCGCELRCRINIAYQG